MKVCIDDIDRIDWQPDVDTFYKKVDDLELPIQIYYPKDIKAGDKRTAVLCIHGGAWTGRTDNSKWDGGPMSTHAKYFALRGAVGIVISYRSVPRRENREAFESGPSIFDLYSDCRSAVRYIRSHAEQFGIDTEKIVAMGDSAGGHLAACLGTINEFDDKNDNNEINAMANGVVAFNPITDLTDESWIRFTPETATAWEKNKLSFEERAKNISPLYKIDSKTPPFLVMHGLEDKVVYPRHSMDFYSRMMETGRHCEIEFIEYAKHAFTLVGYNAKYSEIMKSIHCADEFIRSLGMLEGEPSISLPCPSNEKTLTLQFKFDKDRKIDNSVLVNSAVKMGCTTSVKMRVKPFEYSGTLISRVSGYGGDILGYSLSLSKDKGAVLKVLGKDMLLEKNGELLRINKWNDISFTIGMRNAVLYINGIEVEMLEYDNLFLSGNKLIIGKSFNGMIDYIDVYDNGNSS